MMLVQCTNEHFPVLFWETSKHVVGVPYNSQSNGGKVTAPVTFEFCQQKGLLLSGSRYFRTGKICL